MTNEITSTSEIAELEWDPNEEPRDVDTDMVATKEAENRGIEFHVSMRDYTLRDMEELIVEAAAKLIVGRRGERDLAKQIEAKCIELITAKVNKTLEGITSEIVDQPIIPSFGQDKAPVTMREFIGLTGREFLMERVDSSGKKSTDNWGGRNETRMEYLVSRMMAGRFKSEIESATNAVISEVRKDIEARHKAILAAEKQRLTDALAKLTTA